MHEHTDVYKDVNNTLTKLWGEITSYTLCCIPTYNTIIVMISYTKYRTKIKCSVPFVSVMNSRKYFLWKIEFRCQLYR